MTDKTRGFGSAMVLLTVAVALFAVALTGCSSNSSADAPTKGTVSATDRATILTAMKKDGVVFVDENGIRMDYGSDKKHVSVTGDMTAKMVHTPDQPQADVQLIEMEYVNGTWTRVTQ